MKICFVIDQNLNETTKIRRLGESRPGLWVHQVQTLFSVYLNSLKHKFDHNLLSLLPLSYKSLDRQPHLITSSDPRCLKQTLTFYPLLVPNRILVFSLLVCKNLKNLTS